MYTNPMMIRAFHAVGQGCFATEHFFYDEAGKDFKVIYDCGGQKKIIGREIKNAFNKDESIDVLCISHFHEDHVNGLPVLLNHCKSIKNLWIPFITDEEKILFSLQYVSEITDDVNIEEIRVIVNLINNPEALFREYDTSITEVLPIDRENSQENNQNHNSRKIKSGANLTPNMPNNVSWYYIPFNHVDKDYNDDIFSKIISSQLFKDFIIDNKRLDKDKFLDKLSDYGFRKQIRDFFASLENDKDANNKNSLILYSGGENRYFKSVLNCPYFIYNSIFQDIFPCFYCRKHNQCCDIDFCLYERFYQKLSIESGCLYFGDYNCKENYEKDKTFFEKYLRDSEIILLPHHGSDKSFHDDLLSENYQYRYAVVCHGKDNRYGHPSSSVCEKLFSKNKNIINVTEESSTTAYFTIYRI